MAHKLGKLFRYRLGKEPAKRDERNLMLKSISVLPAEFPKYYNFDRDLPNIPYPVYGNDQLGDCVMVGRGHQTLRFEYFAQKQIIPLTTKEVTDEYFAQTGGQDTGLYVLDSLKKWRINGWIAGGKRYFIKAFTEIDRGNAPLIKLSIFLHIGVGLGLQLPLSAQKQFSARKRWTVASGATGERGGWGGHYVYVVGYTSTDLLCFTWGRKQSMSWAFFKKYCDEAYAIIDALNTPEKKAAINGPKLEKFLKKCSMVKIIKQGAIK